MRPPDGDQPDDRARPPADELEAYVRMLMDEAPPLRVRVGGKNQITLPAAAMERLDIQRGDQLSVRVLPGGMRLERLPRTPAEWANRLQGALAHVPEWSTPERIDEWLRAERETPRSD
jgi:AbrB family looped-hinge helix DNA binding protein